jgi:geranylgeranyl diphosphate synthase type I
MTPPTMILEDAPSAVETLQRASGLVAPALNDVVARLSPELQPAIRHHLGGGGKFVRAGLVLLSAAATGAGEEGAVLGAVAIELVHNFSLLHDDIIDGDTERRHRPTVWAKFGVGQALIAGDALVVLALQLLLDEPTPERTNAAARLASATQAMIAGQAEDMAMERRESLSVEECLEMEAGKTGALLSCAAALGAVLSGAPEGAVDALADFGRHLGIAFQAIDDLLGVWGEPAVTGKPVGSDLIRHKKSLPVAIALASQQVPERLRRLLAGDLAGRDVEMVARMLEDCGVREATMAIGEAHLQAALEALDRAVLVARPRAELVAVARYVTARDR